MGFFVSDTNTLADFLQIDQDQIETCRIRGQFEIVVSIKMSLQLEEDLATYNGE